MLEKEAAMASVYDLMRQRCGLSQSEAADFHGVRLDAIKAWCSDRRPAPSSAVDELRYLYLQIRAAAIEYAREVIGRIPISNDLTTRVFVVAEPRSERQAKEHGFPSTGVCLAAIALAIAELPAGVPVEMTVAVPDAIALPRLMPPRK